MLGKITKTKEQYLEEVPEYRRQEALFHRHMAGRYIGDFVYGANDGIITTFAIVAGASGAALSGGVIIVLGLANILADGISMGASNFLGARSEQDYAHAQRLKEYWEISHLREIEIEEVRDIFRKKGFAGRDLERAVEIVIADPDIWVETMMRDELGIIQDGNDDPKKHGLATFAAFVLAGFFPLLPYLLPILQDKFLFSILIGVLALFLVGALRSLITTVSWWRGGIEMLLVGSFAAIVAYLVGLFVQKLVG